MLNDTGERIIPENMSITNELLIEHLARYQFASYYTYGRVLDFSSGSGYGTHILAKKGKEQIDTIIGVDCHIDAIKYSRSRYYHPKSSFINEDVTNLALPEKLGQFDCLVSFETIEHAANEEQFLANVYNLLKPGGTLIISTPFGKGRGKPCGNNFHVHQLTIAEFEKLFLRYASTSFYYQKGALIKPAFADGNKYPIGIAVGQK